MAARDQIVPGRTLFIRNLPFDTTNEKLEELFGDIGPLKRCFVIKDKASGKCRGFGYATFAVRDDAVKAKDEIKRLDGRKLFIDYADPKRKVDKKKNKKAEDEASDEERESSPRKKQLKVEGEAVTEAVPASPVKSSAAGQAADHVESITKQKHRAACTVVVSGIDPKTKKEDVQKLASELKNVVEVVYPVKEYEAPTAYIRFQSKQNAVKATKKLSTSSLKGRSIKAVQKSQEVAFKSPKFLKNCKLIIRNLSFKCDENQLEESFSKFGEITEVKIPEKPDGKKFGFGFVQFASLEEARTALNTMNLKEILGRPVAVDWAVSRDKYKAAQQKQEDGASKTPQDDSPSKSGKPAAAKTAAPSTANQSASSDESESEMSSDEEEEAVEKDAESSEDASDDDDSAVSASSDDESDEGSDDEDENSSDEDEDEDDDSSDDEDEDDSDSDGDKKKGKHKAEAKSDVDEGKTLFVRNISFDTEEEDLEEKFSEFGELAYCRLVMDPETEHSRGSAFIKYQEKEAAEACLEATKEDASDGGVVMDGRRLYVALAVSREKAGDLKHNKKEEEPKDKRNLWLAREGMIRPGTKSAEGLSKNDLEKRMKIENSKRMKLKNPSIFVSTTRLCIHNLPTSVNDKQLRQVFLKAASDRSAVVTESRIMRDLQRVNASGVGKSKGFGFVNFSEHNHALEALRKVNNNPEIFGESKRPIVEFSLENKVALQIKAKRLERMQSKIEQSKRKEEGISEKPKWRGQKKPLQGVEIVKRPEGVPAVKLGKKGMPKHFGPKIRHKPRNTPMVAPAKDKKAKKAAPPPQQKTQKVKMMKPGKRKAPGSDDFDRLVSKYKKALTGATQKSNPVKGKSGGKWFDL